MKALVLLSLAIACVYARVGEICHQPTDCEQGECCQILSLFPVVSKRQLTGIRPIEIHARDHGTCQVYHKQGERCNSFEHVNGYCGCGPGLRCHGEEVKLPSATVQPARRSMIAPRPGYTWEYKCTAVTN
ncbi:uncharacterized protein [Littorina saxatilis]|uniref:Uncharacterized protein n=1 Tax=Littorina saxatilis TaxID=31220 RepID=A0AAN9AP45_9CAEN